MLLTAIRSLCSLSLLVSCVGSAPGTDDPSTGTVTFVGGASLDVRIADDDEERQRGLMGVTSLAADEGMAFEFSEPTDSSFWMRNTLIPLSIAFIGEDDRVVTVLEMEPCAAEPCPTYSPAGPYVLAVEANAGWFDEHGIDEGDRMEGYVGTAPR
jgi:uncharacterized protein